MISLIVSIAFFASSFDEFIAKPAWFKLEIDSSPLTVWSVHLNDENLKQKTIYQTQPINGYEDVEFMIKWVDGEEVVEKIWTLRLRAGQIHEIKFAIPRVVPSTLSTRLSEDTHAIFGRNLRCEQELTATP